jgi:hypothetical protein
MEGVMKIGAMKRLRMAAQAYHRNKAEQRITSLRLHLADHLCKIYLFQGADPTDHWWKEIKTTYRNIQDAGNIMGVKRLSHSWVYQWLYLESLKRSKLLENLKSIQEDYSDLKSVRTADENTARPVFDALYMKIARSVQEDIEWSEIRDDLKRIMDRVPTR